MGCGQTHRQSRCARTHALGLVHYGDIPAPQSQAVRHSRARQACTQDQSLAQGFPSGAVRVQCQAAVGGT
jgi:hypothetical protein